LNLGISCVIEKDISRRGRGQGLSRGPLTVGDVPDFDGFSERTGDKFILGSMGPVDTVDFSVMCDNVTNGN